ncbi:MAG: hypothetical protein Q7R44_00275 [bacterium]|nr:hypothetical protein [bacterium]
MTAKEGLSRHKEENLTKLAEFRERFAESAPTDVPDELSANIEAYKQSQDKYGLAIARRDLQFEVAQETVRAAKLIVEEAKRQLLESTKAIEKNAEDKSGLRNDIIAGRVRVLVDQSNLPGFIKRRFGIKQHPYLVLAQSLLTQVEKYHTLTQEAAVGITADINRNNAPFIDEAKKRLARSEDNLFISAEKIAIQDQTTLLIYIEQFPERKREVVGLYVDTYAGKESELSGFWEFMKTLDPAELAWFKKRGFLSEMEVKLPSEKDYPIIPGRIKDEWKAYLRRKLFEII